MNILYCNKENTYMQTNTFNMLLVCSKVFVSFVELFLSTGLLWVIGVHLHIIILCNEDIVRKWRIIEGLGRERQNLPQNIFREWQVRERRWLTVIEKVYKYTYRITIRVNTVDIRYLEPSGK